MLQVHKATRGAPSARIADALTFAVEPGQPVSVLGLEPRDRKQFLRLLAGQDAPESGSIRLMGRDIVKARGAIRVVKAPGSNRKDRLKDIAGALRSKADLILIDSPVAGLARTQRSRVLASLPSMLTHSGKVIILMAESFDEARAAGGKALVLHRGRIAQYGPVDDVFGHAETLASAYATAHPQLNVLSVDGARRLPDGAAFNAPHGVRLPQGGACTIAFRPQDVRFARSEDACVRLIARVVGEEEVDAEPYIALDFAGSRWLAKSEGAPPRSGLVTGVFVTPAALMVFDANGVLVEGGQTEGSGRPS
jgi:ABC-type branched-subunit amino acid transport system ATPase component